MKFAHLVGERFKEKPSDSIIDSHALMLRGGYLRFVASGIYSLLPPLKRICSKIEAILRSEMDAIGAQEILFPLVLPASLWLESGRYDSIGSELLRFSDRGDAPLLLGMTHEEAAVHLLRDSAQSYNKYPILIYQIQTKFRDEARPRAGLIRVREFTMKDAYSFHTSQLDLELFYRKCFHAYNRIFAKAGIPSVIPVASDSGMMGGNLAHEFILLSPVGEDSIAICSNCDFRANLEAATCIVDNPLSESVPLNLVHTPNVATIDDVCRFFDTAPEKTCKAVVYQKANSDYVVLFIRGDLEANETKIRNFLAADIHPASIDNDTLFAGSIGPLNLPHNVTPLFDRSLQGIRNLICGANIKEHHYSGLDLLRDCNVSLFHDFAKSFNGAICPSCSSASISISRGIEVGNIFQLGTKYTESMNMRYSDESGELHYPIMGSYGIGVGRLAASICEVSHDNFGPIWPISIAPWQVHLCCLRPDDPLSLSHANAIYNQLLTNNIEVIYDDRPVSAGVMFSDADLLGVPVRVVVSPRNLKDNSIELSTRDKSFSAKIPLPDALSEIKALIARLFADIDEHVPKEGA